MFEAAFTNGMAQPVPGDTLRALDWSEIVARLAATRDVRDLLSRPMGQGGSFMAHAVAGFPRGDQGEPGVNLGRLSCGKWADATIAAAAVCADHGDRDK